MVCHGAYGVHAVFYHFIVVFVHGVYGLYGVGVNGVLMNVSWFEGIEGYCFKCCNGLKG